MESVNIDALSSGMMKRKQAIRLVRDVEVGLKAVELDNGDAYVAVKKLRGNQLEAGMIVLASYNKFNQGSDLCEILGFTGDEKKYGEGGPRYSSVKELFQVYNVDSLKDLEILQDGNEYGYHTYMCIKDLNARGKKYEQGCWFYLFEGRWSRGSGAEPLSFVLMEENY